VCGFYEAGEFGGWKKGDVARPPPPNDYRFLPIHHPIENAGQIFTEAGVRRFTRHEAPNSYCTAFLYGSADLALLISPDFLEWRLWANVWMADHS
jgi:hypothetical protein